MPAVSVTKIMAQAVLSRRFSSTSAVLASQQVSARQYQDWSLNRRVLVDVASASDAQELHPRLPEESRCSKLARSTISTTLL